MNSTIFQDFRWRLLLSNLVVMAAILSAFGLGIYSIFTRNLERQLNAKLQTLAQAVAPSLAQVQEQGTTYLDEVGEVSWRDIFNRNAQSLEWFDANGSLLAAKGRLTIDQSLEIGPRTYGKRRAKAYTISVHSSAPNAPESELLGYIRASQSTRELRKNQQDLLWGLAMGGLIALGGIAIANLWLIQRSLRPIEEKFQQLQQLTANTSRTDESL